MEMTQQPISSSSRRRISLEAYIDFIRSDKQSNLPVNHLTQILRMHGFGKCSAPKKTLMEELKLMELMDPCRSTLNQEKISPIAFMTIEQILKDIDDIKWNECCITSIETLNPVDVDSVLLQNRNNGTTEVSSMPNQRSSSKSKSCAGKTRSVNELYDGGSAGGSQLTDTDLLTRDVAAKKKDNTEAGETSNTLSNHVAKKVRRSTK